MEAGVITNPCEHDFGILLGFGTTTFKPLIVLQVSGVVLGVVVGPAAGGAALLCGGWWWWGVVDCNCIVDASIFEFNFECHMPAWWLVCGV